MDFSKDIIENDHDLRLYWTNELKELEAAEGIALEDTRSYYDNYQL